MDVTDGEFLVIVGASGCSIIILLNLVAGFDTPTEGQIHLDGQPVTGITPECGMIFQQYALFPWKTVHENVGFGMKMKRMPVTECKVMLLDEPFAALDAMTRHVLQEQLVRIYEKHRKTIIAITRSMDEVMLRSKR